MEPLINTSPVLLPLLRSSSSSRTLDSTKGRPDEHTCSWRVLSCCALASASDMNAIEILPQHSVMP